MIYQAVGRAFRFELRRRRYLRASDRIASRIPLMASASQSRQFEVLFRPRRAGSVRRGGPSVVPVMIARLSSQVCREHL